MDPNETLRLYREARRRALALVDGEAIAACDAFMEADEHMSNLLEWLAKTGFEPDWSIGA
jgi:hypothetical protein